MRIVSGARKGKRIQMPKNLSARPTTDLAKEALFNVLNNNYYLETVSVVDLFAGTGNLSYEFASRGATSIIAVDQQIACLRFINKTSKDLNFKIQTLKSDAFKFLEKTSIQADIIVSDPPYDFDKKQLNQIVILVFKRNLLSPNGVLIIEHFKHIDMTDQPGFSFSKRYGDSVFSFFRNN